MKILITADLHLTDRPRDEYRWEVFGWLQKLLHEERPDALVLAGDICDKKDRHSAALVTRVVQEICDLRDCYGFDDVPQLVILKGNHDYIDEAIPFWEFLGRIEGIEYLSDPASFPIAQENHGRIVGFLPHTTDAAAWKELPWFDACSLVIAHQMFWGATLDNGTVLNAGVKLRWLDKIGIRKDAPVISGDIHNPQTLGAGGDAPRVLYVGAPHPINYGDDWTPRVIVYDNDMGDGHTALRMIERPDWTRKHSVVLTDGKCTGLEKLTTWPGDLIKVEVQLKRERFAEWDECRQLILRWCAARELEVGGLKLTELAGPKREGKIPRTAPAGTDNVFDGYVKARKVDDEAAVVGREILKDVED